MSEVLAPGRGRTATVDVVIPIYNEEADLEQSVRRLRTFLDQFPFEATVTIVDNASTDSTSAIAERLARELPGVRFRFLPEKGRGRALRAAWLSSDADVVAYMDVDLSTRLDALLPLVAPLVSGHSDVAIGSRLARGAATVRGPKRELVSRTYNLVLRVALRTRFSDAQCGFKAMRTETAKALVPMVRDDSWFFDTELLALAERNGLRIHEVPVDWTDDPDSRVDVARTALADLRGVARLIGEFGRGDGYLPATPDGPSDLSRFVRVGLPSTLLHVVCFVLLRTQLAPDMANAVALVYCAVLNTAIHLRLSFSRRLRPGVAAIVGIALAAYAVSLAATTAALAVAGLLGLRSAPEEIVAILAGNGVAGLGRFLAFRGFIYRSAQRVASS